MMYALVHGLGAWVYVTVVRELEDGMSAALGANSLGGSGAAVSLLGSEAYEGILSFFAGAQIHLLADVFRESAILPVYMWASLAFMPWLVLMVGFDAIVRDLRSGAVRFWLLRATRTEWALGKLLSQTIALVCLSAVGLGISLWIASSSLWTVRASIGDAVDVWLRALPVTLWASGVVFFVSATARSHFGALMAGWLLVPALSAAHLLERLDPNGDNSAFRVLRFLGPGIFESELWQAGISAALLGGCGYVAHGAAFVGLGLLVLSRRDL